MQIFLVVILVIIILFLVGVIMRLSTKLEEQEILYKTVWTWNEYQAKQISDYESRMAPNLFTFKYAERKLVGIRGEKYSCYYMGKEFDGKQFRKGEDFDLNFRGELPNPIFEAVEIKK